MVPIDQTPFCAPATPINSTVVQEVLPCSQCWGLNCNTLFCGGPGPVPVYPVMGQLQPNPSQYYSEPAEPSSGPSRPDRRHQRLREAGSPYPNHLEHDSSATFLEGGSSVDPDHVWTDDNKTGGGKQTRRCQWKTSHWQAQRHPFQVPITASEGITEPSTSMPVTVGERDRDEVDVSTFEVPLQLADTERYSSFPSSAPPPSSGAMVGDAATISATGTYRNTTEPIEEDEEDAISLGSP